MSDVSNVVNNVNQRVLQLEQKEDRDNYDINDLQFFIEFLNTKKLVNYNYLIYNYKVTNFLNLMNNDNEIIEQIIKESIINDLNLFEKYSVFIKIKCKYSGQYLNIYIYTYNDAFKENISFDLIKKIELRILSLLNNNLFLYFNNYLFKIKKCINEKLYQKLELLKCNVQFKSYESYHNKNNNLSYNDFKINDMTNISFNDDNDNYYYNFTNNSLERNDNISDTESLKSYNHSFKDINKIRENFNKDIKNTDIHDNNVNNVNDNLKGKNSNLESGKNNINNNNFDDDLTNKVHKILEMTEISNLSNISDLSDFN